VTYTLSAVLGVVLAVGLDLFIVRTKLLRRKAFWTAYAIVLFFQLVVNGLLTGLKIVRYDRARIIGWRIAYAPVEDLLFGFAMVTMTLTLWVWAGRRAAPSTHRADR
jgi:lycopene cyclase domain-containing protein